MSWANWNSIVESWPWLAWSLFGNTMVAYGRSLVLTILIFGVLQFVRRVLGSQLAGVARIRRVDWAVLALDAVSSTPRGVLWVLAIYGGSLALKVSHSLQVALDALLLAVLLTRLLVVAGRFVTLGVSRLRLLDTDNTQAARSAQQNLTALLKAALWVSGILFALANFGIDISALVTGLGIGGVALALASQSILGDTFSSFVILLDKPFQIGDVLQVGEFTGTVEHIGFKTTRIRSVDGEMLVFANSDLTGSRLRNFQKMEERRVRFQIGVVYSTPQAKLKEIPTCIEQVMNNVADTRFERCHFIRFGPSSLDFEIIYWIQDRAYSSYLDAQHKINLGIKERLDAQGIEMAFPTQTIYLAQGNVQRPG